MNKKQYCVYILTNKSDTLYIGVTSNLVKRLHEHQSKSTPGFTSHYNLSKLIYYEVCDDPHVAITREKQLKGKTRAKKMAIIKSLNPTFRDLSVELS